MIAFLEPIGLLALAALLVPLVLHFVRRPDEREVSFAALRWISERTRPRQRLRLNDYLLLTLRLLLVTSMGLLLALPVFRSRGAASAQWVALVPGVDPAAARVAVDAPDAEWHWLAPGFPAVGDGDDPGSHAPWSLLRELDGRLPGTTALTVIVPSLLADLDGGRLRLSHSVIWRVVDSGTVAPVPAPAAHIALSIRGDAHAEVERVLVRALAKAWTAQGLAVTADESPEDAPIATGTDWLFWLGGDLSAPARDWVKAGGTVVASRQSGSSGVSVLATGDGEPLLSLLPLGRGRLFQLQSSLTPSADPVLRDPDFPRRLRSLLEDGAPAPDHARATGFAPGAGTGAPSGPVHPVDPWLALAAAVVFLIERLWATRRTWRLA